MEDYQQNSSDICMRYCPDGCLWFKGEETNQQGYSLLEMINYLGKGKKKKVDLIRASGGSKNSYFADNKIVGDIQQWWILCEAYKKKQSWL